MVLVALVWAFPSGALAQALTAAEKAEQASQVDARVERAIKAFRAEDFDTAAGFFQAAFALEPEPIFLFNVGQCRRRQGRYQDAVLHYQRFLRADPFAENPHRLETLGYLRELAELLREQHRPFWRKGLFWGLTGGALALVGASLGLGLGLGLRDNRESVPVRF